MSFSQTKRRVLISSPRDGRMRQHIESNTLICHPGMKSLSTDFINFSSSFSRFPSTVFRSYQVMLYFFMITLCGLMHSQQPLRSLPPFAFFIDFLLFPIPFKQSFFRLFQKGNRHFPIYGLNCYLSQPLFLSNNNWSSKFYRVIKTRVRLGEVKSENVSMAANTR